jgi:hypothetical protein
MTAGLDGHLQLGADSIGGGDQQRVVEAGRAQIEQRAEPAESGIGPGAGGGLGQWLDRFDERVARIDVDTGVLVGIAVDGVLASAGL